MHCRCRSCWYCHSIDSFDMHIDCYRQPFALKILQFSSKRNLNRWKLMRIKCHRSLIQYSGKLMCRLVRRTNFMHFNFFFVRFPLTFLLFSFCALAGASHSVFFCFMFIHLLLRCFISLIMWWMVFFSRLNFNVQFLSFSFRCLILLSALMILILWLFSIPLL